MADNPTIEKLQKKLEKEPNPLAFLQLAEEYRKEAMYDQALKVCHDGLRKHPNYWSMRVTIGKVYHEMGDLDKSRDELEKVIKAVPDNLLANKLLGDIYLEQGRSADALKRYKLVQMITPSDHEVVANIQKIEALAAPAPRPAPPAAPPPPPDFSPDSTMPSGVREAAPSAPPSFLEKTEPGVKIAAQPEPEEPVFPDTQAAQTMDADALEQLMNQASETPASLEPAAPASTELSLPPQLEEFSAATFDMASQPSSVDRTQPMEEPITPLEPAVEEAEELTSQTLAELYVQQGLIDKAVRVYQKLLLHDPSNTQIIQRLKELGPAEPLLAAAPVREEKQRTITSPRPKESPVVHIKNIEQMSENRKRKITTLESWLATIRRERA